MTFDSKFTPDMWAGILSEKKRTNNYTESFHAHINEQFYTSHPTIFIYIDILKKVQATTNVKLRSLDYQTPRKKVEKENLHFLRNHYSKFQDEEISRLDFIKMVGYRFSAKTEIKLFFFKLLYV